MNDELIESVGEDHVLFPTNAGWFLRLAVKPD